MTTITIKAIATFSEAGLVAARSSAEFGQTAAGSHCAVSAERRVVVRISPTGVGYVEDSNITIYPAREAGEDSVFLDPVSGLVWWGSSWTLRILRSSDEPLEDGTIIKDAANAAYQKALLHSAG